MLIHTQPPSALHLLQVYGPETTQRELFQGTVRDLVKEVLQGGNSLVFTYGVTNAGKTFTFLGLFLCHGWNFHSIMTMFLLLFYISVMSILYVLLTVHTFATFRSGGRRRPAAPLSGRHLQQHRRTRFPRRGRQTAALPGVCEAVGGAADGGGAFQEDPPQTAQGGTCMSPPPPQACILNLVIDEL